jgi:hypothetical protein
VAQAADGTTASDTVEIVELPIDFAGLPGFGLGG